MRKQNRQNGAGAGSEARTTEPRIDTRTGRVNQTTAGSSERPQIQTSDGRTDAIGDGLELDPEEVRARAYQIYLQRGGSNGTPEQDWCEAERQLRSEHSRAGRSGITSGAGLGRLAGY